MAGPVAQGGTITLDATYRTGVTGELVDPPDPTVDILDPAGVVTAAGLVPVRVALGTFAYTLDVAVAAALGTWEARWHGTVDGAPLVGVDYFDVVAAGAIVPAANTYGATVGDVQAFIPDQAITAASKPTLAQVQSMLAMIDRRVASRIGDVSAYSADDQARVAGAGAVLVAMGTAAIAWNAAHPDAAGRGSSTYGDWLWEQFTSSIDELLESLNKPTVEAPGAGGGLSAGRPAYNLPEPTFWRDTAF